MAFGILRRIHGNQHTFPEHAQTFRYTTQLFQRGEAHWQIRAGLQTLKRAILPKIGFQKPLAGNSSK
eukprot:6206895-Pleurochrysis_carterae.AAC.1